MAAPLSLRVTRTAPELLDRLAERAPRIGLDGLLAGAAGRARRGRWVRVPAAAAVRGFRWGWRDAWTPIWWPQGIDVRTVGDGRLVIAVSWYAQPHRRATGGARVSFVEVDPRQRPRYRHVVLVEATVEPEGGVGMRPIEVHAGGIAWDGDRLHVAATFGGLRVFDVRNIMHPRSPLLGGRAVLPQREHWRPPRGGERARFSFVSVDRGAGRLLAGEYLRDDPAGRLLEFPLPGEVDELEVASHSPSLLRMQGATVVDGTWYVTTSESARRGGDLWVGEPGRLRRHPGVLAPGPEDLALEPGTSTLWSVSEHPRRRWVYAIDAAVWRP